MTAFLVLATICLGCCVSGLVLVIRGGLIDAIIGLTAVATLSSVALLLLAQYSGQSGLFDVAVAASWLSAGGGLVAVREMERWRR